jgi:hypothetical protein
MIISYNNIPDIKSISNKMQNLGIFNSLIHRNTCMYRISKLVTLLLINFKQSFYLRNNYLSTVYADTWLQILDTRTPAVEVFALFGIEVAGTPRYFLAVLDMTGSFASLCVQFNFKLVNSCMHFLLHRLFEQENVIRTSMVSKTIRIVDYSLTSLYTICDV